MREMHLFWLDIFYLLAFCHLVASVAGDDIVSRLWPFSSRGCRSGFPSHEDDPYALLSE